MKSCLCIQVGFILSGLAMMGGAGCGGRADQPARVQLSGSVEYDGKPVPAGRIELLPDISKGNSGPTGYADIVNGRYDTAHQGKGAVIGPQVAVITGYSKVSQPQTLSDEELAAQPAGNNVLFHDYRVSIEVKHGAATQDFKVPAQR